LAYKGVSLNFPDNLHGGVLKNVKASLGPPTLERILYAYMAIESPEEVAHLEVNPGSSGEEQTIKFTFKPQKATIGMFYKRIEEALMKFSHLPPSDPNYIDWSKNKPDKQNWSSYQLIFESQPSLMKVGSLSDAMTAIGRIIDDGEGTNLTKVIDATTKQFSHFHRFMELYTRRKLLKIVPAGPDILIKDIKRPGQPIYPNLTFEYKFGTKIFEYEPANIVQNMIYDDEDGPGRRAINENAMLLDMQEGYDYLHLVD